MVCLLGVAALFVYSYVEARCSCRDWCQQQGGWMQAVDVEMDSRFHSGPDRCWCQLHDEIKEFAL